MRKIIVGCLISWGLVMGIRSSVYAATLDCSTATNINVPIGECQALLDLYDSTNGPSWTSAGGWDTDSNVCTWYGIVCTNIAGQDRVTSIDLSNNNLNGTLPSSLSALDQISYFNVAWNQINGVLPDTWSSWTNIQSFNIGNNQIGGALPDAWSSWTNIISFEIYSNQIGGALPDAWSSWVNIQYFSVSNNQIVGVLPDAWSSWSNILSFYVSRNQINGILPDSWNSWVKTQYFSVDSNQIVGVLPDSWSSWITIKQFSSQSNQIGGVLPDSWSSWITIQNFNTSYNQIGGVLPDSWSSWTNITRFSTAGNQIDGVLPDSWSSWITIQQFSADNNQIGGVLPDSWSSWITIQSFSVSSNQIGGVLPDSWSSWINVQQFGAQSNQIGGVLPDSWSSWANIQNFNVDSNQINGILPDAWASWITIQYFNVARNQIGGILPDSWSSWISINTFEITQNQINSILPDAWASWITIQRFWAGGNQINGVLPNTWSSWAMMNSFNIDGNNIVGNLPNAWATWTNIRQFLGNDNQMTGTVPNSWITNRQNIGGQYIKLDHNCLSTDSYGGDQIRIDTNTRYNPQNDCGSRDLSITKTLLQPLTLYPGNLVGYSLYYENNGTDHTSNVVITDIPGNGLSIISVSVPYSTQMITGAYGVPGDSCFDDMTNNTIGYYTDTLNQRAVGVYGAPNFQTVLENELGWTGGVNRGYRFGIEVMNDLSSSFQDFLLSNLGIDITTIDSSCGSPDQFGYIFNLGTVGAGITGEIFLTGQVATTGFTLGQTGIMNTAEISTSSSELSLSNNRSSVITPLTGVIILPEATLEKSANTTTGKVGDIIQYQLHRDISNSTQDQVTIWDEFNSGQLSFVNSSITPDLTIDIGDYSYILWLLKDHTYFHGLSGTISVNMRINSGNNIGTIITNTGTIGKEPGQDIYAIDSHKISIIGNNTVSNIPTTGSLGFGGGFGGHIPTPSTDKSHNSAPTIIEQEFIEDNFSCPYGDGDFETYTTTMRDIPKTGAKREAILQLLKKCVVHGKRGEGKLYGTYSRITYGEVYKIIVRSLGLPFNEDLAGHRALPYKAAARKAKLLQGSDTSHSLDDIADTKDVIVLLTNMVNYNGRSIDTLALESIRTPYILRGKFALLVTSLLKK